MANLINIKINGKNYEVQDGQTILEACHYVGIHIPTLCYLKEINAIGACRICVVEVKGARTFVAACVYPVNDGMEVITNSPKLIKARRMTLELILSNHRCDCLSCLMSQRCELQQLCVEYGLEHIRYEGEKEPMIEDSAPHLTRDNSKCILCRKCIAVCHRNQYVGVLGVNDRGFDTHVSCAFDKPLNDTPCISCGQCTTVCPTGALIAKDSVDQVLDAIADPDKYVIVGTAPSIRANLGECFDLPIGTNVEGKMVAALRRVGFDKVFDVDTAADITIMEEGHELIERVKENGPFPLITSCSPGWIRFCEFYYPEFIPNLSSCKSPQQMFGALMKTYYAQKMGIDPSKIVVVSIMPCTAKKFEITREDQSGDMIHPDVDFALTSRECGRMIERCGIIFTEMPDEDFDPAFGIASGAGHIFGATGGVTEAALRTVAEEVTGKPLQQVTFNEVRGMEGIKEAKIPVGDLTVNIAVVSGTANAKILLDKIKSGEAMYHFVEIMACPGGCVNGGGQPFQPGRIRNFVDLREKRAEALYSEDAAMALRKSHENPVVKEVYKEFLLKPGSHKAHQILHTSYKKCEKYPAAGR